MKPQTGRAVVVHPGTLPVAKYETIANGLDSLELDVVDLAGIKDYSIAGLDPKTEPPALADLTQVVVRRSKSQATTPTALIGWSFGGLVASAAVGLIDPAPQLILLDTVPPIADLSNKVRGDVVRWFADYLNHLAPGADPIEVPRSAGDVLELFEPAKAAGAIAAHTTFGGYRMLARAYLAGLDRNFRIAARASPPRLSRIHLIQPASGLLPESHDNGWSRFCDDVTVTKIPGNHYSMLTAPDSVRATCTAINSLCLV